MKTSILPLAVLVLASASAHAQQHWYVDSSAPGPGTGAAQDPFPAIQTAIDASSADDTVHVGPGGYVGNLVIEHDLTLIGVALPGTFTVVSGAPTAQSTITTIGSTVLLSGLIVAPGSPFGGGPPVVSRGTELLVSGGQVTVVDSYFAKSKAIYSGGAIAVESGSLEVRSTRFDSNTAGGFGHYSFSHYGGAIDGRNASSLIIRDCQFYYSGAYPNGTGAAVSGDAWIENSFFFACFGSSAVVGHDAGAVIINSTFSDNEYPMDNATVHNSIVWDTYSVDPIPVNGSVSVSHSIWQGGHPGVGNLDADPLYVDPSAQPGGVACCPGDFSLQAGSPAIDAADNGAVPAGTTTDLGGDPRFRFGSVFAGVGSVPVADMGAYEFQPRRGRVGGPPGSMTF